jgi:hypothetical protein
MNREVTGSLKTGVTRPSLASKQQNVRAQENLLVNRACLPDLKLLELFKIPDPFCKELLRRFGTHRVVSGQKKTRAGIELPLMNPHTIALSDDCNG